MLLFYTYYIFVLHFLHYMLFSVLKTICIEVQVQFFSVGTSSNRRLWSTLNFIIPVPELCLKTLHSINVFASLYFSGPSCEIPRHLITACRGCAGVCSPPACKRCHVGIIMLLSVVCSVAVTNVSYYVDYTKSRLFW